MIASLDDLGCYSNLNEWTRPMNSFQSLADLTHVQIDLLSSAVVNIATEFITFGLIEHMVYTQYMYRIHFGLVFRKPFINLANSSRARTSYFQSDLLPGDYKSKAMARNRIDQIFLEAAKHVFANRLANHLRGESILPRTLRLRLRHIEPKSLLTDPDLEVKINRYLYRFFENEARKNEASYVTWNFFFYCLLFCLLKINFLFK